MRRKRLDWHRSGYSGSGTFAHAMSVAHLADAMNFSWPGSCDVLVFDPPWDNKQAWQMSLPSFTNALVFCDGKYARTAIERFGAPWWIFVWDTMQTWSSSPSQPLNGCKFCLMYGEPKFNRDAAIYGPPPPEKNHPSTSYKPLAGRRLSDLFRASLRWQSNGAASGASKKPPHTKPDDWVCALVGGVASAGGTIIDPFMGGGSSLVAAEKHGMACTATEIDPDVFAWTEGRLTGDVDSPLPLFSGDNA